MTLRVTGWARRYETKASARVEKLHFVFFDNTFADDGWREVMERPDAMELCGIWTAIVLVASRSPLRGVLVRSTGIPYDARSLPAALGLRGADFATAFEFFLDLGWLEEGTSAIDADGNCVFSPATDSRVMADGYRLMAEDDDMRDNRSNPRTPMRTDSDTIAADARKKRGPQDRKGVRTEDSKSAAAPTRARRGAAPAHQRAPRWEDVERFARENGLDKDAARSFYDHFEASGWVNQYGRRIKFWRGRCRSWVSDYLSRQKRNERFRAWRAPSQAPPVAKPDGQERPVDQKPPAAPRASAGELKALTDGMRAAVNNPEQEPAA